MMSIGSVKDLKVEGVAIELSHRTDPSTPNSMKRTPRQRRSTARLAAINDTKKRWWSHRSPSFGCIVR